MSAPKNLKEMTEEERKRGSHLHHRAACGETLTEAEDAERIAFRQAVEADEAAYRAPAKQRQEAYAAWQKQQNEEMALLLARQEAFVEKLREAVRVAEQEHQSIVEQYQRLTQATEPVR
jgi:mannitol-1-phosphate/altronate dehydrogenase